MTVPDDDARSPEQEGAMNEGDDCVEFNDERPSGQAKQANEGASAGELSPKGDYNAAVLELKSLSDGIDKAEEKLRCCGMLREDSPAGIRIQQWAYMYPMVLTCWLITGATVPKAMFGDQDQLEIVSKLVTLGTLGMYCIEWTFRLWASIADFPPRWLHVVPRVRWQNKAECFFGCCTSADDATSRSSLVHGIKVRVFVFLRCTFNVIEAVVCVVLGIVAVAGLRDYGENTNVAQAVRLFFLVSRIPGVEGLIIAFFIRAEKIASTFAICVISIFLFAYGAHRFFGDFCADQPETCGSSDLWGSLQLSMWTCLQIMTMDSWASGIARPVITKYKGAWVFFTFYILIVGFILANLITGVIIDAIGRAQDALEDGGNKSLALQDIWMNYVQTGFYLHSGELDCDECTSQSKPEILDVGDAQHKQLAHRLGGLEEMLEAILEYDREDQAQIDALTQQLAIKQQELDASAADNAALLVQLKMLHSQGQSPVPDSTIADESSLTAEEQAERDKLLAEYSALEVEQQRSRRGRATNAPSTIQL